MAAATAALQDGWRGITNHTSTSTSACGGGGGGGRVSLDGDRQLSANQATGRVSLDGQRQLGTNQPIIDGSGGDGGFGGSGSGGGLEGGTMKVLRPEAGAGGGRMFVHVVAAAFLQSRNVVFACREFDDLVNPQPSTLNSALYPKLNFTLNSTLNSTLNPQL